MKNNKVLKPQIVKGPPSRSQTTAAESYPSAAAQAWFFPPATPPNPHGKPPISEHGRYAPLKGILNGGRSQGGTTHLRATNGAAPKCGRTVCGRGKPPFSSRYLCGRAWLTLSAAEPGFCRLMLRSKGKGVVCSSAGAVVNFRYEEPPSVGNIRHPAPSVPLCCRLFSAVKRS